MDAAVGLKLYRDVAAAAPGPENEGIYRDLYERVYLKTYDRQRPLNREIQRITGYPPL